MNSVKKGRAKLRMSQEELAKKCAVGKSYISRLENNKRTPSNNIIKKISSTLNICPVEIFKEVLDCCNECQLTCPFYLKK